MNNQTQIGITIAGVAVVSAVAAVVFNKILPDKPQVRDSYQRSYPEEKAEDNYTGYDSEEGGWKQSNFVERPKMPYSSAPISNEWDKPFPRQNDRFETSAPRQNDRFESSALRQNGRVEPSAPPRPSFDDGWANSESKDHLDNFADPDPSFSQAPKPLPITQPEANMQEPKAPGQGMMGGMRQTRCKHCHSTLRYTRRR